MKINVRIIVISFVMAVLCVSAAACGPKQGSKAVFYVSPSGNDSWSGKLPEHDKMGLYGDEYRTSLPEN